MEVEGYRGLFYILSLLKKSHGFPATFLLEDGKTISPRNITEEFWKQVNAFIDIAYSGEISRWDSKGNTGRPRVTTTVEPQFSIAKVISTLSEVYCNFKVVK